MRNKIHRSFRQVAVILVLTVSTILISNNVHSQNKDLVVRVAKLVIDPPQLEAYKTFLKEGIETSVRTEPGVLTMYAVYEKENPNHVLVFEIYANTDAYKSHLETPHFKKYKTGTKEMVKSLDLVDVVPIGLETKPKS